MGEVDRELQENVTKLGVAASMSRLVEEAGLAHPNAP
jgi:hypothetical protein